MPNPQRLSTVNTSSLREGWVEKEGAWISPYRPRYLKITEVGTLAYYITEEDANSGRPPRGSTGLLLARAVGVKAPNGSGHPFAVRLQDGSTVTFRTQSKEETAEWVEAITQATANATLEAETKAADVKAAEESAIDSGAPGTKPPSLALSAVTREWKVSFAGMDQKETPGMMLVIRAEMEKAFDGELALVRTQLKQSADHVTEAQEALARHESELQAVRAEKATKIAALLQQQLAVGSAATALGGYEAQLELLDEEVGAKQRHDLTLRGHTLGVKARLTAEADEVAKRIKQQQALLVPLEADATKLAKEAAASLATANEATVNAKQEVHALTEIAKLKESQRQLLKERITTVEQEHGLATARLEGKTKAAAIAMSEAEALAVAISQVERTAIELGEQLAALQKEDAASAAMVRLVGERLAVGEATVLKLITLQEDFLTTGPGTEATEVWAADVSRSQEVAQLLRARQDASAATHAARHEECEAQCHQLLAEQAGAKAVQERKASLAARLAEATKELELDALKCASEAAVHGTRRRALLAEHEAHVAADAGLQSQMSVAEAEAVRLEATAVKLQRELDDAAAARGQEIASEARVLSQQKSYLAQLEVLLVDHPAAELEELEALPIKLLASANAKAQGRHKQLEQERAENATELAALEQRLRAQEAAASADVSSCMETLESQQHAHTMLRQHEGAVLRSAPVA